MDAWYFGGDVEVEVSMIILPAGESMLVVAGTLACCVTVP